MFKQKLYRSFIILAMFVCAFTIWSTSNSSVHASAVPNYTTTKTQIVQAPAKLCAFLKKSAPTTFRNSHDCSFKYTSTDVVYTQNSSAQSLKNDARPLSCGPATVVHSYKYTELPDVWSFAQTATFHWNSMCANVTSVYNHDCRKMWAAIGFTVSPNSCIQYGGGGVQTAEDDINYGSYIGGTNMASIYSKASSYLTINDWWS